MVSELNKRKYICFHLALIFVISLSADLLYLGNYGLYSDDWHDSLEHLLTDNTTFIQNMNDMLLRQWEMRPLRTVEYICQRIVYSFAGLSGVYILQALLISISMLLLYLILIVRIPKNHALLIPLIFSLSPLDTTTLWLATMHHRFCLVFCLLAMYSLIKGKNVVFSAVLLMISLLFSELSFGIFLLSPLLMIEFSENRWINKKIFYPILKKTVFVFLSVFSIYILWRIVIAPLYMEDMRINEMLVGGLLGYLSRYVDCFRYGYQILIISSLKFLGYSLRIEGHVFLGMILAFSLLGFIYFCYKKKRRNSKIVSNDEFPNNWFYILYYICIGLITVLLSYWYGRCYKSCLYMGGLTRFNFPTGIAYAFFSFGLMLLLFKAVEYIFKSSKLSLLCKACSLIFTFSLLTTHRIHIQKDYAENWQIQKNIISDMYNLVPELPENMLIILSYTDSTYRAMHTFKKDKFWQTDFISEMLYGPKRELLLKDDINEINMKGNTVNIKAWDEHRWWLKEFSLHSNEIIVLSSTQEGRLSREDSLNFVTESQKRINIEVNSNKFVSANNFSGNAKALSFLGIPIKKGLGS